MINHTKKIISKSFLLFIFVITQCSDNPTSYVDSITVNLPMKKKAIYAVAYYDNVGDSDSLVYIRISSFYFDSIYFSNDTTYLIGRYERLEPDFYDSPISGNLLVSLTDDWVFFQNSDIIDAGIDAGLDLTKPLLVDTTSLPTPKYSYFPVYPRILLRNNTYSIYRPGNYGNGWGYGGVYREFNVKNPFIWNDYFGTELGFQVIIKHILSELTIYFDLIIDQHGIINSQFSFTRYEMPIQVTDIVDSIKAYRINRRIVDYTTPSNVNSLSYYADEVREKGLKYIK